jgi:hypothetical protein
LTRRNQKLLSHPFSPFLPARPSATTAHRLYRQYPNPDRAGTNQGFTPTEFLLNVQGFAGLGPIAHSSYHEAFLFANV